MLSHVIACSGFGALTMGMARVSGGRGCHKPKNGKLPDPGGNDWLPAVPVAGCFLLTLARRPAIVHVISGNFFDSLLALCGARKPNPRIFRFLHCVIVFTRGERSCPKIVAKLKNGKLNMLCKIEFFYIISGLRFLNVSPRSKIFLHREQLMKRLHRKRPFWESHVA